MLTMLLKIKFLKSNMRNSWVSQFSNHPATYRTDLPILRETDIGSLCLCKTYFNFENYMPRHIADVIQIKLLSGPL